MNELIASSSDVPLATVTFDDGFRSVLEFAHPILKKLSIPYTVFLNRCAIEGGSIPYPVGSWRAPQQSNLYLNLDNLKFLMQEGVTLGSHTLHHKILAHCEAGEEEKEIRENKEYLESALNLQCDYLAAPFGKLHHISDQTLKLAKQAGHSHTFSTLPYLFHCSELEESDFFVPRIPLLNNENWEINFVMNRSILLR